MHERGSEPRVQWWLGREYVYHQVSIQVNPLFFSFSSSLPLFFSSSLLSSPLLLLLSSLPLFLSSSHPLIQWEMSRAVIPCSVSLGCDFILLSFPSLSPSPLRLLLSMPPSPSPLSFSYLLIIQIRHMVSVQPKHPLYGVVVILTLSVLWRIGVRRILAYAGLANDAPPQTKIAPKRKICADKHGSFVSNDSTNNFLQTTTFGGSFLWVAISSFLYGAIVSCVLFFLSPSFLTFLHLYLFL